MMQVGKMFAATFRVSPTNVLDSESSMRLLTIAIAAAIKSEVRSVVSHKFQPQGVTAIAIIAESHISVHTFPEHNLLTVDIFCCNPTRDLSIAVDLIHDRFNVLEQSAKEYER